MQILFGPEQDGLHVDPYRPGAYEWWYFDALSDDGRWALVIIYFLGSPMSPYYKTVVDGKNSKPMDWCGVFVSLHENVNQQWIERAYAYNLYRHGEFTDAPHHLRIGLSTITTETSPLGGWAYHLSLQEKGLWTGETRVEATFTPTIAPIGHPPLGDDRESHTWACVAPVCKTDTKITLANGSNIVFQGHGYHDHNYGQLPWNDMTRWYWMRSVLQQKTEDELRKVPVGERQPPFSYSKERVEGNLLAYVIQTPAESKMTLLFIDLDGNVQEWGNEIVPWGEGKIRRMPYGMRYEPEVSARVRTPSQRYKVIEKSLLRFSSLRFSSPSMARGYLLAGPFYQRMAAEVDCQAPKTTESAMIGWRGWGIGEVFEPARLCHPLWSQLMWTRIRRRG